MHGLNHYAISNQLNQHPPRQVYILNETEWRIDFDRKLVALAFAQLIHIIQRFQDALLEGKGDEYLPAYTESLLANRICIIQLVLRWMSLPAYVAGSHSTFLASDLHDSCHSSVCMPDDNNHHSHSDEDLTLKCRWEYAAPLSAKIFFARIGKQVFHVSNLFSVFLNRLCHYRLFLLLHQGMFHLIPWWYQVAATWYLSCCENLSGAGFWPPASFYGIRGQWWSEW